MAKALDLPELVGIAEIAGDNHVSRQAAHKWTKQSSFPKPVLRMRAGPFWRKIEVAAWVAEHRPGLAGEPSHAAK